ncbi:hypothetical protein CEUSTIGMA_g6511.t1 [Chlamydomonas eustigma]|uniref:Uncharacterized protein n=1 Tax=Chlamydomonas eustigma TaxID=1157962 RepID=A0A250X7K6_9CHLO|nr:hypothetical protein CEUSTIGMA_g6511.t1 [Chlamydomonas eustigma]|eukprot:GAX79071.1 hypothetical protein CEUSTIGMA_g6511.t1 [Chlamydomonas eustigma]
MADFVVLFVEFEGQFGSKLAEIIRKHAVKLGATVLLSFQEDVTHVMATHQHQPIIQHIINTPACLPSLPSGATTTGRASSGLLSAMIMQRPVRPAIVNMSWFFNWVAVGTPSPVIHQWQVPTSFPSPIPGFQCLEIGVSGFEADRVWSGTGSYTK